MLPAPHSAHLGVQAGSDLELLPSTTAASDPLPKAGFLLLPHFLPLDMLSRAERELHREVSAIFMRWRGIGSAALKGYPGVIDRRTRLRFQTSAHEQMLSSVTLIAC
jgi:hypothetical protein